MSSPTNRLPRECDDGLMPTTYRPGASRLLAGAIFAIGAVAVVALIIEGGVAGMLRYGWWVMLVAVLAWALFWNPRVHVDASGVLLVNVFRTIRLPWPSIQEIDTKWSLTLKTAYGSYSAWAAPSPGRHGTRRVTDQDLRHLPQSSYDADNSVRPGDAPTSPSGQAAWAIRDQWEALRDAGHLDNPRLEFERPPVTWHVGIMLCLAGLCALAVAGMVL